MFLSSNYEHFYRDVGILTAIGIVSYLVDLYQNSAKYTLCMNIQVQSSHLLHHIFIAFLYLSWLSKNKYILTLNLLLIIFVLVHWINNNKKCGWSQHFQEQCKVKTGLNTFLQFGLKDNGREKQVYFIVFLIIILILKLAR